MNINRRNFLGVLGVTGLSLCTGEKLKASPVKESKKEFFGVLYDSTRCVGCQSCEFACASSNGLPEPDASDMPEVGKIRKTNETRRTVVNAYNTSQGEVYVKKQCMQCNEPACAAACLTQAMYKTESGPVIWRDEKCMGCRYCMVSCPFDMPKFEYNSPNPDITKCDMCYERTSEGQLPACVEACPSEALTFGTRRELLTEAHRRISENPEMYHPQIYGEAEAGGTGFLYLSPVPFEEIGLNTSLQKSSYPALTKGFLYSVPSIFVLWPVILLGIHKSVRSNTNEAEDNE